MKSIDLNRRFSSRSKEIGSRLISATGSSLAPLLVSLLSSGNYKALQDVRVDPSTYSDRDLFFQDYAAVSILSKYQFPGSAKDLAATALKKFISVERDVQSVHLNLKRYQRGGISCLHPFHEIFRLAKRKIGMLLGDFSWSHCERYLGFGPGASIGIRRVHGDSWYKFGCKKPTVTSECLGLAKAYISLSPVWCESLGVPFGSEIPDSAFNVVPGNKITTVPKNSKTDRVIAVEPLMNMFFQKGVGGVIRSRLKRAGIYLHTQYRNQCLARKGSIDGSLATIDLSSASDSISLSLVEQLLPDDWVACIKLLRSQRGSLPDGSSIYYSKVSSMGNGFTFELEALIFWAFCSACCTYLKVSESDLSVYGDDIIVPTSAAELVVEILSMVGFSTNRDKSYLTGPFRESCGKHYFLGSDVTPIYIRKDIVDLPGLLVICNNIRRLAFRSVGSGYGCDGRYKDLYTSLCNDLPEAVRKNRVPVLLNGEPWSDAALGGDFDESKPSRHPSFEGFRVKLLVRKYKSFEAAGVPMLCKSLFSLEHRPVDHLPGDWSDIASGVEQGRILTPRYKNGFVKTHIPQWSDVGPWLPRFSVSS